ncbi:hypothetical protein SAMN05421837_104128 [Amycolatopsis pretoriensis]|uniref:Uncharacterized protein n=1 Tax=Amycolatopsis pretoriensis TaxID=218821 RepID=A0A1H5QQD9_9PSEU|nr:hypothetical protein SAMN05421837_104128 [Amycolatopsis pretoriensis]
MVKSKRPKRGSRTRNAKITRSRRPAQATGRVSGEPSWPASFARGALYSLGKKAADWLIEWLQSLL